MLDVGFYHYVDSVCFVIWLVMCNIQVLGI